MERWSIGWSTSATNSISTDVADRSIKLTQTCSCINIFRFDVDFLLRWATPRTTPPRATWRSGFRYSPGLMKLGTVESGLVLLRRQGPIKVVIE